MKLYETWFAGDNCRDLEIELPNTNIVSIIYDGNRHIFWGGKTPRPWNVKGKRMRILLYDSACKNLYRTLLNEMATTVRKLSGIDKCSLPWWAELHRAMFTMRSIEQAGGALWEETTNESAEIFGTYIPRQGVDETLTKLMVACGFGFSGKIDITSESLDITSES
ncbi:MAG: hypothetical protein NUV80_00240 [Candidatus Berkelbacteria bacterium]|nr:hypothetical protein [Candidatus Berkelbacteria bacterium]